MLATSIKAKENSSDMLAMFVSVPINVVGNMQVVTRERFTLLMIFLVVNTAITTPLIKLLYNPNRRYLSTKRRTVQHLKPNHPIRILTCVHSEDHVAPIIDFLEAATPTLSSPFMIYLLHLTELAGRAVAVLRPYKQRRRRSTNDDNAPDPTPSDRIFNAFRYFENQHVNNTVSLSPFVAISPIATMHNDVCSLAHEKKCCLIILPYAAARASVHGLNRHVLGLAPCSVAVLVDRVGITCTLTNHLLQSAVVFFIGGADDREALAIAMRMAAGGVALTVVRFRPRGGEEEAVTEEEDEEVLGELRMRYGELEGVLFVEKAVTDGPGMVAIAKDISGEYDLVIIGRREGDQETEMTRGLPEQSEFPELGILGDLVQQQVMAGARERRHDRCGSAKLKLLGHT